MSLINSYEQPGGQLHIDEKGVSHLMRRFIVESTTDENEVSILTYFTVYRGQSHPFFLRAICKTCKSSRWGDADTLGLFQIICEYDNGPWDTNNNNSDPSKPPEQNDNATPPDQRSPTIVYGGIRCEHVLERDTVTDAPVVTTTNEKFDPPLVLNRSHRTIGISGWKGVNDVDPDLHIATFYNSVNDAQWKFLGRAYKKNSLLVTEDSWTYSWEQQGWWLKYNIVLEYNPSTWKYFVANMGTLVMDDDESSPTFNQFIRIKVIDKDTGKASFLTTPVPINKITNQRKLPTDVPPIDFLEFNGYDLVPFNGGPGIPPILQ